MPDWPVYDDDEIDAVTAVLRSGKVNAWTGPDVTEFEAEYRAYTGSAHAIAMANGSVTLDAALHVLGIEPGDEVIVSPRSFIASVSTVLLAGGVPVFADVDRDSQNITAESIAPLIGPRTRGILPVHLGGWPANMPAILDLARAHGLWVIEDCAQAHGAKIGDQPVGTMGDFGSFSFCQDKIISTGGEGGMLLCRDEALWKRAWSYKDHGKDYDAVFNRDHPPGFRWLHAAGPGTNLRMTGLSAAIGRRQLTKLDGWRAHRSENASILADKLGRSAAFRIPLPPGSITHAYYRFYAFVRTEALATGWDRARIMAEIAEAGYPISIGGCPEIYREGTFTRHGVGPANPLPIAQELGETSLAFLTDPTWSRDRTAEFADVVYSIAERAVSRTGSRAAT